MRRLRLSVGLLLATSAAAQHAPVYLLERVAGADALAVGVLWSHGYADDQSDECGLAHVLATCRLARANRAVPDCLATGLQVDADCALAFAVVGGGDGKRAEQFLTALLDEGSGELRDDDLALITARAALAADDAEFLYPGSVLLSHARRQLGQGTAVAQPPFGVASDIAKLSPGRIRAALRRCSVCTS